MDKTKYVTKAEVQTALVMPKTLEAQTEMMKIGGVDIALFAVYGRDDNDAKVWCCTFVDSDEAMAWVQASRVFGRAVRGAVIAQQETKDGTGTDSRESVKEVN